MKKVINLLLGLLMIATGFNVVNANGTDVKGHYLPRLDLFQDAFRAVQDSFVKDKDVPLSKYFIYTSPDKFEAGKTDYEAWVPAETKYIFLGITHEKIHESDGLHVPTYEVVGTDNAGAKVDAKVYRWSIYRDNNVGDTTLVLYTNPELSDSTQYYVFDFSKGAELTGSITITIPDGHVGYVKDKNKTTYKLTLKRSDDINKISGLKSLAVFETGDDESILKNFDKFTTDYEVESAAGQDFTVKFEPILANSTIEAFVNGVKVVINEKQALREIPVTKAGGEVELIVTAPNGASVSTYKIKIVQTLEIPSNDLKPNDSRYKHAKSYIKRLYLTDGENEYELYNKFKGHKFDGYLYTEKSESDSNTYVVSVPNPSASNLELGYELHFDQAYKFTLNKQRFFVDKTTGQKISWTVHLKEKADGASNPDPDPEIESDWKYVFLDTIGTPSSKSANGDSLEVKYTIELLSNEARLEKLSLHFGSDTTPAVELSPAFDPDSLTYTLTSSVHKDLKDIYLVYKSFDKNAKTGSKITQEQDKVLFSPVPKTTDTYRVSVSDWKSGQTKYISISDTAVDKKTVKSYVIELKKDYNLTLTNITIKLSSTTIADIKGSDFKVDANGDYVHNVLLPVNVSYDDLFELEPVAELEDKDSEKFVSWRAVPQVKDFGFTYIFKVKSTRGDTHDYLVNLILATNDATLDYLYTTPAGLTPEYSPEIFDYTLTVPATTASVRLIAAAKDQFANLTGNGVHTITEGTTVLPITVTPGDKSKPNIYTVTVIKEGTGINSVANSKVNVFARNGQLNVTSPYNERVYIHAADGSLIASFDKKAGNKAVSLNLQTGIIILRGSAGWTYKVFAK
ncbi:MAG: cadherin-like beta sandwich domain-containing protein [Dysgonamonadaceae bacterium]|jgi:hypothetical protein|nr:cadherin-like beta sandwich domain-containing protein [Dysgonamonadaceae bacterium]